MKEDDQEKSRANLASLLLELKNEMQSPVYKEKNILFARHAYSRYQAFLSAGFTPDQALTLASKV